MNRKDKSGTPQIGALKKQIDEKNYFRQQGGLQNQSPQNMNFLSTPEGGQARVVRQSYAGLSFLSVQFMQCCFQESRLRGHRAESRVPTLLKQEHQSRYYCVSIINL
jgi:hypothetical protein